MNPRLKHIVFNSCLHPVRIEQNGRVYYVGCGKCAPCLHQRSNMLTSRVQRECSDNAYTYFVTLTYDNNHLPLCRLHKKLNRWIPDSSLPCVPVNVSGSSDVCLYHYADAQMLPREFNSESYIPFIKSYPRTDCFGIVSRDDCKRFIKRLRTNLNTLLCRLDCKPIDDKLFDLKCHYGYRRGMSYSTFYSKVKNNKQYNYEKKQLLEQKRLIRTSWKRELFRYFLVAEYGPSHGNGEVSHHRPHYHALLFCQDERVFKLLPRAVRQSWTLCRPRNISISPVSSQQACGYVAKYVTGNTSLPRILQTELTRTFYLSSRRSAIGTLSYTFEKVQDMYVRGTITENYRTYKSDGSFTDYDVRIPKCVLSRYFPKCKSYGTLSRSEKLRVYSRLFATSVEERDLTRRNYKDILGWRLYPKYEFCDISGKNMITVPSDMCASDVRAATACAKWCAHFGVSPSVYLDVLDWFYYKIDMDNLEQQFLLNEEHPKVVSDMSFLDDLPECLDPAQFDDEVLSTSCTIMELRYSTLGTLIWNYLHKDVSYFYDDAGYLDMSRVSEYYEYGKPWFVVNNIRINDAIAVSNKSKVLNDAIMNSCY